MRESASPSEGGKGPLGGGTRLYGVLEAVLRLLTFGRCAENTGKCLTSEGGKGPLGGGTRLYGALEAVLRLLTFGR